MTTPNIQLTRGSNLGNVSLDYPIIALHQLWISELEEKPREGLRNAIFIPHWLYKKAGLKYGEKIVLTRENCQSRHVEAERNRTVTSVFPWSNDYAIAVGPTAKFLGEVGPSCFIAYAHGSLEEMVSVDLNFPFGNTNNNPDNLIVRSEMSQRGGQVKIDYIHPTVYAALQRVEREVLVTSISGLKVEVGDPYCNPKLAQIPREVMESAGLSPVNIKGYFSSCSKPLPALASYVAPSSYQKVAMSGALFGAFPIGSEFVIDIYGRVKVDTDFRPTFVHVKD